MRVELLYFDGCPAYLEAEKVVREVLAEEGAGTGVVLMVVNTDDEADRLRFPGSPTIRVDDGDLLPTPDRADWRLGCRVYATPEGLKGSPTTGVLRAALG